MRTNQGADFQVAPMLFRRAARAMRTGELKETAPGRCGESLLGG